MKEIITHPNALLVDVRTPDEYAEAHAPGTINIPLDSIESRLNEFKDKDYIVVFCRSGNRSGMAKMILEQHGFQNILNAGTWQDVAYYLN